MKIAAIGMFKNEEDIAYNSVLSLAEEGVNTIIVADNMSTDNTLEELHRVKDLLKYSGCEVVILEDKEVGYYQSKKMTALAHKAHDEYFADWIIAFDADEIFYTKDDNIYNTINALPENVNVITCDLYNHFPSAIDTDTGNPFVDIAWRQECKGSLPKVAVKYNKDMVIEQGNHSVTYPLPLVSSNCLEIRHFPYRSWKQFKRKAINGAAAYAATDLPFSAGQHWRQYGEQIKKWGDEVVRQEVYLKYFCFFSPIDNGMIYDPAPFRRWNK